MSPAEFWAAVLKYWGPLLLVAAALKMWITREQDRRHDEHEAAVKAVNARIGLEEGTTVKAAIDGVGRKVDEVKSSCTENTTMCRDLRGDVQRLQDAGARMANDMGGIQSLMREMIERGERHHEAVIKEIHASAAVAAERDAQLRERVARLESRHANGGGREG